MGIRSIGFRMRSIMTGMLNILCGIRCVRGWVTIMRGVIWSVLIWLIRDRSILSGEPRAKALLIGCYFGGLKAASSTGSPSAILEWEDEAF